MTIHMELGPSTVVGIGLAVAGLALYVLRTRHPGMSRDYDLFFSSVGLLCGGILLLQGWRLDPILLLCQSLSSGTAIFFVAQNLWLRSIHTEHASHSASAWPLLRARVAGAPQPQSQHQHQAQATGCWAQGKHSLGQMRLFCHGGAMAGAPAYGYTVPLDLFFADLISSHSSE